jgi:hypothetical protein
MKKYVLCVTNPRNALFAGVACAILGAASPASAVAISTTFNFVPTTTLTSNTGNVTTAATITSGAPDLVTSIVTDNTGLVTLSTVIGLATPTPVTLNSTFTKTFTTALGTFVENLTVSSVTTGLQSLGIAASGTITETVLLSGSLLASAPVFYSASYTQNGGPGAQINGSFNDSTTAPIGGTPLPAALPLFASGLGALGLLRWRKKRKNAAAIAAA